MQDKRYISTTEAARILGISRVTVFKKIKNGSIPARHVGRNFVIDRDDLRHRQSPLLEQDKEIIDKVVARTVKEYGETLKLLGNA